MLTMIIIGVSIFDVVDVTTSKDKDSVISQGENN